MKLYFTLYNNYWLFLYADRNLYLNCNLSILIPKLATIFDRDIGIALRFQK